MQILNFIFKKYLFFTVALIFVSAQNIPIKEYQIKAAFLFNFTQFVEWPQNSFVQPQSPLVIGILGKDHFGNYLDQIVSGETLDGHALEIKRFKNIEEIKDCHILFISNDEAKYNQEIINALKGSKTLTVSEASDFILNGGMIRFKSENNKIQLQINPEAAKNASLTISAKLLRLAEIVSANPNNK